MLDASLKVTVFLPPHHVRFVRVTGPFSAGASFSSASSSALMPSTPPEPTKIPRGVPGMFGVPGTLGVPSAPAMELRRSPLDSRRVLIACSEWPETEPVEGKARR